MIISQLYCMKRAFHLRNIIRRPQASRLSSENQGHIDQNSSEIKQSPDEHSLNQLVSLLTNLISANISNKKNKDRSKNNYQLEARDREVSIDLPIGIDKMQTAELKLWTTDVVKTIFSSAFNSVSKNQMSFQQAKIYCSENIFKNIVRLSEKYRLSDLELELIDNHIKDGVLKYLAAKYPLTDSTVVNKKLQEVVRQVDNIESLDNNYFTNSKIVFQLRQSGNYNDLIMEMLNDLMSKPDMMKSKEKTTNYQDFQKYMSDLFQMVEDEQWTKQQDKLQTNHSFSLNPGINLENKERQEEIKERIRRKNEEKEKYRAKVKEYTHYLIGRKISENAPLFTPAEIENGNIQIKNPQTLRILTKWCEELYEKYCNSYFRGRSQSIKLQRGQKINNLQPWLRIKLDQILSAQKQVVRKTMNELLKNNYEMQANVLQNEFQREGDEHIDEIQKISGKFSHKIVKNLHSYIIIYLNKLIHGLLKAAIKLLDYCNFNSHNKWTSPLNLLSFKIGDLMRCKCSSKEKEILRIYEEITRISKEHPQKLKIVRIKNRLRSGTNDILMNVRFNDSILCEIQLAIKTTASEFIKCSNNFHHYLYQLQRSLFGPLTQLGSIWNSLDKRAEIYQQLVEQEQNESKVLQNHICLKLHKNYEMKPYEKSFVCNSCKISYFHNRFIMSHAQCSACSYILCAKCRIEEQAKTDLKGLLRKWDIIDVCGEMVPKESKLPNFGLCIFIEAKQPKVEPFTLITYRDIDYLLSKKDSRINLISRIRSKKEKGKFRNNFLLFEIKNISIYKPIQQKQAINKYILPLIMKQNYKKQKETISLMDMNLSNDECRQVLSVGSHSQKQCVKNIFLTDNLLTELPFNPKQFPNVEWITLSRNEMKFIPGIEQIHHLKSLFMESCGLNKFPEVFECKELKQLHLEYNQISQIDDRIINLTNLQTLLLSQNKLTCLPQSLFECKALTTLTLQNNQLQELPQNIKKLQNLEALHLQRNQITTITQSIGELTKLKEISLAKNGKITSLPSRFAELKNLQSIDISETSIREIPCPQEGLAQLKVIKMKNTKVKNFPIGFQKSVNIQVADFSSLPGLSFDNLSYQNINTLEMRNGGLTELPLIIQNMKNLRTLDLSNNRIEDCKDSFSRLRLLQSLNLNKCNLTKFPNLSNCCNLKTFNLSSNKLTTIPAQNIEGLVNLEQFNCQQNKLTVLPTNLTKLKKLKNLSAASNKLETLFDPEFQSTFDGTQYWPELNTVVLNNNNLQTIPLPLCYCPNLKELQIKENIIKLIPPEIKHSSLIKKFVLSNNSISEMPEELSALTQLSYLDLDQNQIVRIPLFVQNFTKLTEFYCNNETIQTIQCLDWLINCPFECTDLRRQAMALKKNQEEAAREETNINQNP